MTRRGGRAGAVGGRARPAGPPADPEQAARDAVLRQLSMGPRTRAQLSAALRRRQIPADVVEAVLDRFEDVRLVDDQEFARQWVETRHHGKGLARRALAYELRNRGVDGPVADGALQQVSADSELAAARALVRRRAATMTGDDPTRKVRRLAGMLARKGYGPGVAMQAIREQLADPDPDPEATLVGDLTRLTELGEEELGEEPGEG